MAAHSSTPAWEISRTEEPGGLPWGRKESDTTERLTLTQELAITIIIARFSWQLTTSFVLLNCSHTQQPSVAP